MTADAGTNRSERWTRYLTRYTRRCDSAADLIVEGTLRRVIGLAIEADGCTAPLGGRCDVVGPGGSRVETEVVGFAEDCLYLMATRRVEGMVANSRVVPRPSSKDIEIGPEILGRVLNGRGEPIDDKGALYGEHRLALNVDTLNPLKRRPIDEPLDVGIRSINALLTLGRGQRVGLFAGSGVGKSMLLGMMTRHTTADVVVVGLIGERGREVGEFVLETLGTDGLARSVVIATPADDTPLMRLNGAWLATAIAEYFRDKGLRVLLLMDSLTRFAQAQREVGLAIGEPPTTKGYPPSVFAKLPQLVERAGNGVENAGSITAIYTVLAEGDDPNDPIVDAARAILDGHLVLSREMAEDGVFPAIDFERSVSRSMHRLVPAEHRELVAQLRSQYATYRKNEDLITIGAYQRGADHDLDRAIELYPRILSFLRQDIDERASFEGSADALGELLQSSDQTMPTLVESRPE